MSVTAVVTSRTVTARDSARVSASSSAERAPAAEEAPSAVPAGSSPEPDGADRAPGAEGPGARPPGSPSPGGRSPGARPWSRSAIRPAIRTGRRCTSSITSPVSSIRITPPPRRGTR